MVFQLNIVFGIRGIWCVFTDSRKATNCFYYIGDDAHIVPMHFLFAYGEPYGWAIRFIWFSERWGQRSLQENCIDIGRFHPTTVGDGLPVPNNKPSRYILCFPGTPGTAFPTKNQLFNMVYIWNKTFQSSGAMRQLLCQRSLCGQPHFCRRFIA